MPKPTGPSTPKKVAGPGPRHWHQRLADLRYRHRVPIRQPLNDAVANGAHYAIVGPLWYLPRAVLRTADWFAIPLLFAAICALGGLPFLAFAVPVEVYLIWYAWMREQHRLGHREMPRPLARFDQAREIRREQKRYDSHLNFRLAVLGVKHKRYAKVNTCRIPESYTNDDLAKLPDILANSFTERMSMTFPAAGLVALHHHHGDAFAVDPTRPRLEQVADGGIPLGVDMDGEQVDIRLFGNRFFLIGRPDSGKSTTTNSVLAYVVRLPHVDVRLYDAKGGMDLSWAWPFCTRVAVNNDDALQMLEDTHDDMLIRQARLGMLGRSLAPIGPDYPLVFLVLVEFMSLLTPASQQAADKAKAARASLLVREIARLGRATGFVPWLAQQDLYKRELPAGLAGKFNMKLGFAVETWQESEVIFPGGTAAGVDLSKIPIDRPGQGVLRGTSEVRHLPIRTFRLFDPLLTWEAQQLSCIRPVVRSEAPRQVSAPVPLEIQQEASQDEIDPNPAKSAPTTDELRELVAGKLRAAGQMGVALKVMAADFGVPDHRVKTALGWLRARDRARTDGTRWYWTGEP